MNEKQMQAYEEEKAALHKRFNKIRLRIFLLFLAFNVVADAVIAFIWYENRRPLAWVLFAAAFVASAAFALSTNAHWKKEELNQQDALREKIPMNKFRI